MRRLLPFALLIVAACGKPAEPSVTSVRPERPPVAGVVDLQVLAQEYNANQAAGDEKYTGRLVTVDASVKRVEKTDAGGFRVRFEWFVDGFNFREGNAVAVFPEGEAAKLAGLEYRSPVRFTGRCDGLEPSAPGRVVVFRDCRIDPPPK